MLISDADDYPGAVDKSVGRFLCPWTYPWLFAYPHNPWPSNE